MLFENLDSEEREHIKLFMKHFIGRNKQGRWKTILSMKPEKWVGVSAYDCNQPGNSDWNTPISDTITKLGLQKCLDHKAHIFQIGHGAYQGVHEGTLRSALLEEHSELECVISIVPGKLTVCYGHSNEFRL